MKKVFVLTGALAVFAVASAPAMAQVKLQVRAPIYGYYSQSQKLNMLKDKGVQKELDLSDMQVGQIEKINEEFTDALKNLKGRERLTKLQQLRQTADKRIEKILSKKQAQRLDQLKLQSMNPFQILNTLSKDLNIDKGKKTKLKQMMYKKQQELQQKINRMILEEVVKNMTPEQQKKFKELYGKQYEGKLPARGWSGVVRPLPVQVQPRNIRIQRNKAVPQKKEPK